MNYKKPDFQDISYYSAPNSKPKYDSIDEVDPELLDTFNRLGISLDEQKKLAGVAVDIVVDSVSVATTFKKTLAEKGIIFCSISCVHFLPHVNGILGLGNKIFEGNTYVEDNTLVGIQVNFEGSVSSYTISPDYQVYAFIKVFNSDFSFEKKEEVQLTATGTFSVSYTNVEATDAVVQYGFRVVGLNANPANEGALGSVIVGEIPSTTVTVNASATQNGYANVFFTDGNFAFGGPWGVPRIL